MFNNIIIENFRGIEYLKIDSFSRVNLIVGRNNSGKTTLLEALFIAIGIGNPRLPININIYRDIILRDSYFWSVIFNKLNTHLPIRIITSLDKDIKRTLEISPYYFNDNLTLSNFNQLQNNLLDNVTDSNIKSPLAEVDDANMVFNVGNTNIDDSIIGYKLKIVVENGRKKEYEASISIDGAELKQLNADVAEGHDNGRFIHSRRLNLDIANRFHEVQLLDKREDIEKILQNIEPELKSLFLGKDLRIWAKTNSGNYPLAAMGDGINHVINILLTIFEQKTSIVLIDEIDNGLDVKARKLLWKVVFKTCQEYGIQVFATTHSYETIACFEESYDSNLFTDDGIKLIRIDRRGNKHSVVDYNPSEIKEAIQNNWEVRG